MTQLATDNFHRANGSLTAPWSAVNTLPANFQIASNVANVSSLAADTVYKNTTIVWPNDHYSEITVGTPAQNGRTNGYGAAVRCDTTANTNAYRLIVGQIGWNLEKIVAGVFSNITGDTLTTFLNGDVARLMVQGNVLTCYKNGIQFASATESSIAAGTPGIAYSSTANPGGSILLWAAGDLSAGPQLPFTRTQFFVTDTVVQF